MYTIGDTVTPLNKYHTHEDIIHRKKRVARKRGKDEKEYLDVDYLLVSAEKKDASEDEDGLFGVSYGN